MKIQEIAREAGVSPSTVSRVFSNHPNIRGEVREQVFAVARKYGYRPRLSSKQQNVVIVSPYKTVYPIRSYVEMVISELALALSARGFRIEMLPQDNLGQLERIRFCAAVSIGIDAEEFGDWEECFASPLVIVDRDAPAGTGEIYSVRSDEHQAMELGIGCLAAHGRRNIGTVIYGEAGTGNADLRREGALLALKRHKLPATARHVRFALAESYVEEVGKLLKLGIDGLFAPGGNAGILAAYALSLYNRRVPEEISLVTSERTMYSRYAISPQTTISQDYTAQAEAVADAIDSRLRGMPFPRRTVIPYKLIERDSVNLLA
ncbi:HTH-type transcriptional regulator TreR [bioreactor metagenome]|uniref:HTH-type transcriptional regulator TreR n=1 Tax=bioreactor metagenome TaxID=1076179 RepID=A0A645B368_9ZZZZ